MAKLITCINCNKQKFNHARGLCKQCYMKQWRNNNLCNTTKWQHKMGQCKPMSNNKNCSSYLGIHIAEKLVSKIFKNLVHMSNNNIGYDFIDSDGNKIDVKASTRQINNKNKLTYRWKFHIDKNIIADYFICIAFNNRNDVIPEHLWLIPNIDVNNKMSISISKSKLNKWSQYEQSIDKVIDHYNTLRGN